ncbi:MAG: hypothetical protein ABL986_23930 [Vicinamibacterales bacterium]
MPRTLPYVVAAFHTDHPVYNRAIARLKASLVAHDLPHLIKTLPSSNKWRLATRYKPTLVRTMLEEVAPLDVLYLDADSEVLLYPSLFEHFEGSFGVYLRPGKELWSAILYVKNDERGREWARVWEESVEEFPRWHDQTCLQHIVDVYAETIGGIQALPENYSCKAGKVKPSTVIAQYQIRSEFLEGGGTL